MKRYIIIVALVEALLFAMFIVALILPSYYPEHHDFFAILGLSLFMGLIAYPTLCFYAYVLHEAYRDEP